MNQRLPRTLKGGTIDNYIEYILTRYVYSIELFSKFCRIEATSAHVRVAIEYLEKALILDLHPCTHDLRPSDRAFLLLAGRDVRKYVKATSENCQDIIKILSPEPRGSSPVLSILAELKIPREIIDELKKFYGHLSRIIHGEVFIQLITNQDIPNTITLLIPSSCTEAADEARLIADLIEGFTDFLVILKAIAHTTKESNGKSPIG